MKRKSNNVEIFISLHLYYEIFLSVPFLFVLHIFIKDSCSSYVWIIFIYFIYICEYELLRIYTIYTEQGPFTKKDIIIHTTPTQFALVLTPR